MNSEEGLRKLTDEEKQKITSMVHDLFYEELPDEPTEYDVLMQKKTEEFTAHLLQDNEPEQIEALLEMCDGYYKPDDTFSELGLIVNFDMWLNESSVWPVMHNPKWEEWEKLKKIKVKKEQL